ncbi:type III secretion system chaperone [Pseudomonas aeruginosa]|uniref:type III secretion system chaperone n=1 Tax=Pseudomonadota TaxID=1224 RepID=UPI0012AAA845|nr:MULTISPECIES: type III secretion system chaperone [Pseudomonadota]MBP8322305.1 type III secretion system chaperone [Pseudomonas aeruginosa]MCZ8441443.1 type III secretion system chaperone [Achromobacter xylosoxidans]MDC6165081.1 type III secretion system chaperone [Achromobacter xylosoxidans]CUR67706.1 Tir chaperone protein (CesT) [Achromobacter xylosoxidans]
MHTFRELVAQLGAGLAIPDMEADEDGYVALDMDGHIIHLQEDAGAGVIVLYAVLQEIEEARLLEVCARLLTANAFWRETGGATLALDEVTGHVLLCRAVALNGLDMAGLETALGDFADAAAHWAGWLASVNDGGALYDEDGGPAIRDFASIEAGLA